MLLCYPNCCCYALYFLGITREPGFLSKRKVPYQDPQISKSFEWHGPVSQKDVVLSPKPKALETVKSQEEIQDFSINQERVPVLEACRVPKRTRSHSTDSRAEDALDIVENNEDEVVSQTSDNENVQQNHSKEPLPEDIDNGVGEVCISFQKCNFPINIIISVM